MPAKSAKSPKSPRTARREVYLFVVENWACDTAEIVAKFPESRKLLTEMERKGLLASTHVNGEKALTWQSYFDVNNEDGALDAAKVAFNEVYPTGAKIEAKPARSGATGPRYSQNQIKIGLAARKAGKTNAEVAKAAGVKSPNYFAKVLKEMEDKPAKKATKRTVKRSGRK